MPPSPGNRNAVFISYGHRDKRALERLHVHLRPYEHSKLVDYWDDTRLKSGAKWREEIDGAVARAKVAILLVSADFLASEFIAAYELPQLLNAAEKEGAVVLSVILRPCAFKQSALQQFQAINDAARPLSILNSHLKEELWARVAEKVVAA